MKGFSFPRLTHINALPPELASGAILFNLQPTASRSNSSDNIGKAGNVIQLSEEKFQVSLGENTTDDLIKSISDAYRRFKQYIKEHKPGVGAVNIPVNRTMALSLPAAEEGKKAVAPFVDGSWACAYNMLDMTANGTSHSHHDGASLEEIAVTQLALEQYNYDRFKTSKEEGGEANNTKEEENMHFGILGGNPRAIANGNIIADCVAECRSIGNLRHDEGTPDSIVSWVEKEIASVDGIVLKHLVRGDALKELGLLYAVGKGAVHPSAVMVLEYVGNPANPNTTALVGKGVCFDSGGMNIKPFGSMEYMHLDKMGALAVLCSLKAIAQLKLHVNCVVAVGLVENAIGPQSLFPSTILCSLKGKTVEIANTDAEGRLVLADVFTYVQTKAQLEKKVGTIIDLATLTGAIVQTLGCSHAGLFSNDSALTTDLLFAGNAVGEHMWPMPIAPQHLQMIKSDTMGDIINCKIKRQAGSCTAAAFLHEFVEKGVKWAHIDIAGTGMGDNPLKEGASGWGVKMLVEYLRRKA